VATEQAYLCEERLQGPPSEPIDELTHSEGMTAEPLAQARPEIEKKEMKFDFQSQ
jgi:hypothetical protein